MKSLAFLVNDISAIGGSTKVTIMLANEMAKTRKVKIISLFKSQNQIGFSLDEEVEVLTLFPKQIRIFEISTYVDMLKKLNFKPILQLIVSLFQLIISYPWLRKKLNTYLVNVDTIVIPEFYGLYFINYKKCKGKEIILQLHHNFKYITENKLNLLTLKIFKNRVNKLVVLTNDDQKKFEKFGFNRVIRIYNPIIEKKIDKKRLFKNHFVYVGRLDYIKGIDYLLEIFKEISSKHDLYLDICGDGPMRLEIESFIKKNGLNDRIILHGVVKDLSPILLQSICLVAPSRLEGLPLVFLEAFQHQLPIVSFNSFPAISDIITESETGFIIQQGDIMSAVEKIEFLYLEAEQNKLMGLKCLDFVQSFKLERIIEEWNKMIEMK